MALAGRNRERLNELLSKRHECADSTAQIDQQIRTEFEHRVAILVLDMCQFTEITKLRGFIHYLAMIGHLARIATPIVEASGGFIVKREADNLFAAFLDTLAALEAAL